MSSNGSSMSQWKRSPPLTGCYQTIRARPPQRTLEETSAASLHSDTSASHTLPPQRAREPCGQRQRVKKIYKKKMEIARAVNSNQSPLLRALPGAPLSCG